jgi:hypothetical protein
VVYGFFKCVFYRDIDHIDTAKIRKNQWVANQKIRSKWKAVKRKEGLVSERKLSGSVDQDIGAEGTEKASEEGEHPSSEDDSGEATINPSRKHIHASGSDKPQNTNDEGISLRDLAKEAYSRSSLHTFKSDPLNRKKRSNDLASSRGRRTASAREANNIGRGQPNMKLRMDVLLEKIKRDFT